VVPAMGALGYVAEADRMAGSLARAVERRHG
jgi:hypothetical protein